MLLSLPEMKEHIHAFYSKTSESFLDGSSHRGTLSHVSDIVNIQDLTSFYFQIGHALCCSINQAGMELEDKFIMMM